MMPRIRIHERHVLMWLLGATMATIVAGALWLAIDHRPRNKPSKMPTPHLRWMHSGQDSLVADYFDPSVMSLPDVRGFSGTAWRRVLSGIPAVYEPDRRPSFLTSPANAALPVLLAEKPLGELVQVGVEWTTAIPAGESPTLMPVTNSVLEVVGALRGRTILHQPQLPLTPVGVSVRGTRVLVAATGDGRIRYAVVERSSGNEVLDTAAVAAVRELWFAPEPSADPLALTWGSVRLVWAVRI